MNTTFTFTPGQRVVFVAQRFDMGSRTPTNLIGTFAVFKCKTETPFGERAIVQREGSPDNLTCSFGWLEPATGEPHKFNVYELLDLLRGDYSHEWPNETTDTRIYRQAMLTCITSALEQKNVSREIISVRILEEEASNVMRAQAARIDELTALVASIKAQAPELPEIIDDGSVRAGDHILLAGWNKWFVVKAIHPADWRMHIVALDRTEDMTVKFDLRDIKGHLRPVEKGGNS